MNINNIYQQFNSYNSIRSNPANDMTKNSSLKYQYNLSVDTINFSSKDSVCCSKDTLSTLDKLYSSEFKKRICKNEDGYYVTSVINKRTKKIMPIYVQKEYINDHFEKYNFYKKSIFNKYKQIGTRTFGIDYDRKVITSGYMESKNNDKYAGIGLRGHQLAVERMIQLGFKNVEIVSLPNAFAFHYKSGFRPFVSPLHEPERFDNYSLSEIIDYYADRYETDKKNIEKYIDYEVLGDKILVNQSKLEGDVAVECLKNNKHIIGMHPTMTLPKNELEKWVNRAKSQPILLEYE